MKKLLANKKIFVSLVMAIVAAIYFLSTQDCGVSEFVTAGVAVVGTVTTEASDDASTEMGFASGEELKDVDYSKKVAQYYPDSAPLDTVLRSIPTEETNSVIVGWGDSGFNKGIGVLQSAPSGDSSNGEITLTVTNPKEITVGTLLQYKNQDSTYNTPANLTLYVIGKDTGNSQLFCRVVKGNTSSGAEVSDDSFGSGTLSQLNYIGTAKNEKDAQTEALQFMPNVYKNYCQIHMAQVEQGDYDKIQAKKFDWGIQDYKNDALYKFRLGCEMTSLIGVKSITTNAAGSEVYTASGLEEYVGWNASYYAAASTGDKGRLDLEWFNRLGDAVFSNVNSSEERFLFCSSQFYINFLKCVEIQKMVNAGETLVKHGITVRQIDTGFGILNLKVHKGLSIYRPGEACIVDATRSAYRHFAKEGKMSWKQLDLRSSGQAKADVWVLSERSCPQFRVKPAHAWIYESASSLSSAAWSTIIAEM